MRLAHVSLASVALASGLLPIVTVFTTLVIAASLQHVPTCFPLIDGCTSISATGRQSPESLVFRAMMIPSAMLLMLFWYLMRYWLVKLSQQHLRQHDVILYLGLVSSVFLIVYSVALGFIGDVYQLQRRIGVTLFFACELIAQLMVVNCVWKLFKTGALKIAKGFVVSLVGLCLLLILIGLSSIPLSLWMPESGRIDNIIEWNYGVLMYFFNILFYFIWRSTRFGVEYKTDQMN